MNRTPQDLLSALAPIEVHKNLSVILCFSLQCLYWINNLMYLDWLLGFLNLFYMLRMDQLLPYIILFLLLYLALVFVHMSHSLSASVCLHLWGAVWIVSVQTDNHYSETVFNG